MVELEGKGASATIIPGNDYYFGVGTSPVINKNNSFHKKYLYYQQIGGISDYYLTILRYDLIFEDKKVYFNMEWVTQTFRLHIFTKDKVPEKGYYKKMIIGLGGVLLNRWYKRFDWIITSGLYIESKKKERYIGGERYTRTTSFYFPYLNVKALLYAFHLERRVEFDFLITKKVLEFKWKIRINLF